MTTLDDAEIAIIGGGIVGLASAYQLSRRLPGTRIVVLEKEPALALHQTGRNSGVIHSGIYYRPGSFKASFCRDGKRRMEDFCQQESIPFEVCGKLIVALDASEERRLEDLLERGKQNHVRCELWGADQIQQREPHARGNRAIYVPETGIVDYRLVATRLGERIRDAGGHIHVSTQVQGIQFEPGRVLLTTNRGTLTAKRIVNCAGLFSDRICRLAGGKPQQKIVPFRGEYFELKPSVQHLCKHLI